MRKTATKVATKTVRTRGAKPKSANRVFSAEDQLAEHLKQAEHHLIEAVKLFSGPSRVSRRVGYQKRLETAQEAITGLYREELVRIRGPWKNGKAK